MKKIIILLLLNLLISPVLLSQNLPVAITKSTEVQIYGGKEYYIHVVRKGQTLYSLSKVYEIPIDEIIFENPELKKGLFISQIIRIPVESRDELIKTDIRSKNFEFFYHIAKEGEQFRDIGEIYSVSRRDLQYANPGIYEPLKEGQYLKIPVALEKSVKQQISEEQDRIKRPQKKKETNPYQVHTVTYGENLYRIALNYGCSIDDIKKINTGLTNNINNGQRILIPKIETKKDFISHTVQRREKLSRIARNYNVNRDDIKELNPSVRERPYPGQKLKIPSNYEPVKKLMVKEAPEVLMIEESVNKDSIDCFSDFTNLTKEYKVALMIPFYLEDVDSLRLEPNTDPNQFIKERSFRYLPFYYGALMAIDSLKKQGLNIDLRVYDVDGEISKTIKVLQDKELQEMDLIIGPLFSNSFTLASKFALLFKIPIVNPMSTRSNIVDNNPYVYKFQPTEQFHKNEIRNLVSTYFTDSKIFFLKHHKTGYDQTFKTYEDQFSDLLIDDFSIANDDLYELLIEKSMVDTSLLEDLAPYILIEGDTVGLDYLEFNLGDSTVFQNFITEIYYSTDSVKRFEQYASTTRENVVFTLTDNNVFALDIMTQLNILRDSFPTTVVGLPHWSEFTNMDNELFMNLKVHTLDFTHLDYKDAAVISFVKDYRKKYLTEPTNYAFTMFDLSWYFLNALMNFGPNFSPCLPYFEPNLIQSKVEFFRKNEKSGMENRGLQMLKYQNYELLKVLTFPPPKVDEIKNSN